jgi:amino acid transporter
VYCFFLATSVSVIVLRYKEPQVERPFKVTGYPFTPIVFAAVCGLLIYGGATYRPLETAISLGILLTGVPVYFLTIKLSSLIESLSGDKND